MKPFFSYLGSKFILSKEYGAPRNDLVIEPFAGSAAYSTRWEPKNVLLIDLNPKIAAIWKFLISADECMIRKLPLDFISTDELDIEDGAKWLIGLWLDKGTAVPKNKRPAWARQYRHHPNAITWNEAARERIASQVSKIRHWKARTGSFESAPQTKATWLIDPPYQLAKSGNYPGFQAVDYKQLAAFCKSRKGQLIVCEGEGADWLPFKSLGTRRGLFGKHRSGKSDEVLYVN